MSSKVKVISFVGRGNIGKSVSVEMIGRYLAGQGKKVIIIDMDTQAGTTGRLGTGWNQLHIGHVLTGQAGLFEAMRGVQGSEMVLVGSSPDLDEFKAAAITDPFRLRRLLAELGDCYVLIDTPGSADEFAQIAVLASNLVVGVTDCNLDSFARAKAMAKLVNEVSQAGTDVLFYGYLVTKVTERSSLHRDALATITGNGTVIGLIKEDNSKRRATYFRKAYADLTAKHFADWIRL